MSAETAKRTIAVISEFGSIPVEKLSLETSLSELNMDSLDGLNLIFELEEEFDIVIPDEKALALKTIGQMVEGIDRLRSGEALGEDEAETADEADTGDDVKADPANASGSTLD